jgi:hypothetical protein
MAYTSLILADLASGASSVISPRDGIAAASLDVAPTVRAVEEDHVGGHGANDRTRLFGSGGVTLAVRLFPALNGSLTPELLLDEIQPMLDPGSRPVLIAANDQWGGATRQIGLRFDSLSGPVTDPSYTDVALSWKAPGGVWQATNPVTATIGAFIDSSTGLTWGVTGLTWTSAGAIWPATTQVQPPIITNPGGLAVPWTARIYGPCTGPKLGNDSAPNAGSPTGTGLTLEWTDALSLAAGEYVDIDSAKWSALRNGDPGQPVDRMLNFGASNWWLMGRGVNQIRYYPTAAGAGSVAQLSFNPGWTLR